MDSVTEQSREGTASRSNALRIDSEAVPGHVVDEVVRGTVQETLKVLRDIKAERACGAGRYQRGPDRQDQQIDAWPKRPIEGRQAYVYLDGIWLKRSWGGEIQNVAGRVAIGVNHEGFREVVAWPRG